MIRQELLSLNDLTSLLIDFRMSDPVGGLYEPADVQWWWCTFEENAYWVANGANKKVNGLLAIFSKMDQLYAECFWKNDLSEHETSEFLNSSAEQLKNTSKAQKKVITVSTRDDDSRFLAILENHGFEKIEGADQVQMHLDTYVEPGQISAPCRVESRGSLSSFPHPLAKRNGSDIEDKLKTCSLYDSNMDLVLLSNNHEVAGYCLAWFEPKSRIGLIEPFRIEDNFQGQGLGKVLLSQAIECLKKREARFIKITHEAKNPLAQRLYKSVGFSPKYKKLFFRGKSY